MTNQTKNIQNIKPGDFIRIGHAGCGEEHGRLAVVLDREFGELNAGRGFWARLLEGAWRDKEFGYNFHTDFEVLARAAEPVVELDAYRPGDEFPNVGYVRRMTGQDRVENRAA